MQPAISVAMAQRIVAILLFFVATAPVWLLGLGALCQYKPRAIFQPLITLAAYPGGGAQWFAYLALLISTWAGATLAAVFVVRVSDVAKITRYGVGFLLYVALTVGLGVAFVMIGEIPEVVNELLAILPRSLVDPTGADEAEVVAARAADAIEQMTRYVHWAIGSLLTLAAAILAIPAPASGAPASLQN